MGKAVVARTGTKMVTVLDHSATTVTVTEVNAVARTVGLQGPKGAGFNWRGAWDSSTAYAVNDVVEYDGSSFVAVQANSDSTPAEDNSNPDWSLFAASGDAGSDANYVHTQNSASTTWTVNHGLAKFPAVTVVDSSGNEVIGAVQHIDENNAELTFSAAFSGKAYFN